jgi:hypothetical protein
MSFTDKPLLVRAGEVEELALGDDGLRLLLDGDAAEAGSVNLCRSTMSEFLDSQGRYDNHLVESVAWSTFLADR